MGLPQWFSSKEPTCSAEDVGDTGLIPGLRRSPGEGNGNPLQYTHLGKSHGQRSWVGYRPWGHKALDTTVVTEHTCVHRETYNTFNILNLDTDKEIVAQRDSLT